ncbi:hypothetical protein [Agrobacterium pusense]|uniref:hypothetical protein n=1 Tax=Agrobacterium pusense TaxID=648995 RepID=UPI002453414B|nr:hypothetical protein [Agrobacterium pusense]
MATGASGYLAADRQRTTGAVKTGASITTPSTFTGTASPATACIAAGDAVQDYMAVEILKNEPEATGSAAAATAAAIAAIAAPAASDVTIG